MNHASMRLRLTRRQFQFLEDRARGLSYKEIAHRRSVSILTVKNSLSLARQRTDAKNITHLVAMMVSRP